MAERWTGGSRPGRRLLMGVMRGVMLALIVYGVPIISGQEEHMTRVQKDLAEAMLKSVADDVEKHYFDAKLHGLDWDALVQETKENIDQAPNLQTANAEIAALLEKLDDSHTQFLPPPNANDIDYGFRFKIVGKRAFVTRVVPKSNADKKGVKPGEELITLNGFAVDREDSPKLKYALKTVIPQSSLQLVLLNAAGKLERVDVRAGVKRHAVLRGLGGSTWASNQARIEQERVWEKARAEYKELGPDLMVLRIPEFVETGADVNALFKRARAHKTLIVDLRGTPGGNMDSIVSYLGHVFDREVTVGNWVEREKVEKLTTRVNRRDAFEGDLIVLIDSETASGGEIFARVVQLQERGTILGDHSSGQSMVARYYSHWYGQNPTYFYGAEITIGDEVMTDGKRLEHIGVEPDRVTLPTAADLAAGRDPVLAYAAGLAGVKLSGEDAAKLFAQEGADD